MSLAEKKCIPCEGGVGPLSFKEIQKYLSQAESWELVDNLRIFREFKFKNFQEAIDFVNEVAKIAESEGHHPDIFIHYNKVKIELWTHSILGLHANDFIMAAKINQINN